MPDAQPYDDIPPGGRHRRREARLTTILLVARVISAAGDYLCRVRNVATGGMMIDCAEPFAPGERLRVELRNGSVVDGAVVWAEDGRAGMMFDAPVEVDSLLHPIEDPEHPPRVPRLSAGCPVLVWHDGQIGPAILRDISQSGCRLTMPANTMITGDVRITVPGLRPHHATLRWTKGDEAGFAFHQILSFGDLSTWQQQRHYRFVEADAPAGPPPGGPDPA